MRRALNVLQACHAAYDRIDEVAVYNCTGNPLPADVEKIVDTMMNGEFTTAYKCEINFYLEWSKVFTQSCLCIYIYMYISFFTRQISRILKWQKEWHWQIWSMESTIAFRPLIYRLKVESTCWINWPRLSKCQKPMLNKTKYPYH